MEFTLKTNSIFDYQEWFVVQVSLHKENNDFFNFLFGSKKAL